MNTELNEELLFLTKRRAKKESLTPEACIAINLLWRKGIRASLLAQVFGVSKNTIYYRALTGDADSYPTSSFANSARDTNELINQMGEEAAWKKYVKPAMIAQVNEAMEELASMMR